MNTPKKTHAKASFAVFQSIMDKDAVSSLWYHIKRLYRWFRCFRFCIKCSQTAKTVSASKCSQTVKTSNVSSIFQGSISIISLVMHSLLNMITHCEVYTVILRDVWTQSGGRDVLLRRAVHVAAFSRKTRSGSWIRLWRCVLPSSSPTSSLRPILLWMRGNSMQFTDWNDQEERSPRAAQSAW